MRKLTHKTMIQIVSNKIGNYHRPKTYKEQVKQDYGVEVTNSSIWKALGNTRERRKYSGSPIIDRTARHLLNVVGYYIQFALHTVKMVSAKLDKELLEKERQEMQEGAS